MKGKSNIIKFSLLSNEFKIYKKGSKIIFKKKPLFDTQINKLNSDKKTSNKDNIYLTAFTKDLKNNSLEFISKYKDSNYFDNLLQWVISIQNISPNDNINDIITNPELMQPFLYKSLNSESVIDPKWVLYSEDNHELIINDIDVIHKLNFSCGAFFKIKFGWIKISKSGFMSNYIYPINYLAVNSEKQTKEIRIKLPEKQDFGNEKFFPVIGLSAVYAPNTTSSSLNPKFAHCFYLV